MLDLTQNSEHTPVMASVTVQQVIALASQLSEEERHLVVDTIEPKESIEELTDLWQAEIEKRAERVRSGNSTGSPADEVFARVEAGLKQR